MGVSKPMQTGADESFPKVDRDLFQLLADYPLETYEGLAEIAGTDGSTFRQQVYKFCDQYQCSNQIQILNWELIGLQSFFVATPESVEHPYVVRQYKLLGEQYSYLTQCVAPNLAHARRDFAHIYPVSHTYRPGNNIQMLYQETQQNLNYLDDWLLNLKEIMVDEEMGDIVYVQEDNPAPAIEVDEDFLDQLGALYTRGSARRFTSGRAKESWLQDVDFIATYDGFVSPFLEISIPNMTEYVLLLDKLKNPKLFVGGFIGKFPQLELYETENPNALICRFEIPEHSISKFHLTLLTYLLEVCYPSLWLLIEDTRHFDLPSQWRGDHWAPFSL
jgi:hypothetical protein